MLSAALLERWPQVCRVKITFTKLPTNRFVSITKISMKYVVNWIPLRIRVRSRNTQPHLKKVDFIGFFLRILRILLHLKFPSNSQDFTTPQTAFLYNHSSQAIGKIALFEKSCHNEKEEARTGWCNVDRSPQKIGCKSYILDQSNS